MLRKASHYWMPLLVIAAVALGVFVVMRLHGVFGSVDETTREGSGILTDPAPFDPKRVTYEVFGPPGSTATINFLDLSSNPQRAADVPLPWSISLTTTEPAISPNLMAQGTGGSIGCRITVDDEVKDERSSDGVKAFTYCLVKSA